MSIHTQVHMHIPTHIFTFYNSSCPVRPYSGLSRMTCAHYFFNLSRKLSGLYTKSKAGSHQRHEKSNLQEGSRGMTRSPERPLPGCSVSQAVTGSSQGEHLLGLFTQEEHRKNVNKISGHKFIPGGPGIPCIPGKPLEREVFNQAMKSVMPTSVNFQPILFKYTLQASMPCIKG